jgi:aspartate/methionine/tyrosine aminotransferase
MVDVMTAQTALVKAGAAILPGGRARCSSPWADRGSVTSAGMIADASLITVAERLAYQDPGAVEVNAGPGYPPIAFGPQWIREIREHPPPGFLEEPPGKYDAVICDRFRQRFGASHIMLAPSATDAFALAAHAVSREPGDEVILVETSYDSYPLLLRRFGARVVYARRDLGGMPDPASIAAACTGRTRAVVLVCPDNPLGVVTPRPVMEQLAALCSRRRITLIVDYTLAEANPFRRDIPVVPLLKGSRGLSWIMLGDTGKVLGLSGAKFGAVMHRGGWLGDRLAEARSIRFFEFDQCALATVATIMSDARWLPYLHQACGQIAANYRHLRAGIQPPLTVEHLDGGCFALIDATGAGMDGETFARLLREEYRTLVIPVSWFSAGHQPDRPDSRIRVALTRPAEVIERLTETLNAAAGCPRKQSRR